jgi:hypothetical protein
MGGDAKQITELMIGVGSNHELNVPETSWRETKNPKILHHYIQI